MLRLPVCALSSSVLFRAAPRFVHSLASPAFYPWYTTTALPPPPPLLHLPPPAWPPPLSAYAGHRFGHIFRPICFTTGLGMERPEREREPPPKRRKSSEEIRAREENTEERTCKYKTDTDLKDRSQSGRYFSREKDSDRTKKAGDPHRSSSEHRGRGSQSGEKNEYKMEEEVGSSNPWTSVGAERQKTSTWTTDKQAEREVRVTPLNRLWEPAPLRRSDTPPPPGVSVSFDFTVMSYNILSQDLLLDNAYLYRHCHPGVLSWDFRLPNLLREIQQHDADILCLQEVQEDHFVHQIRPALEALGYKCVYKKRTGDKSDGCAVVYRRSRLSLLSSNPVEFYRRGDALLDRDNVGLVVRLSATSDPASCICVANTHLLYNPRRGDIKLAQLAILLAEVGRLSRLPDGSSNPVVVCGDFNSTPSSPLYRFLTTGKLDYRGLAIGMVSGQEQNHGGQRWLCSPLWSDSLGISSSCQYHEKNHEKNLEKDQEKGQEKDQEKNQEKDQEKDQEKNQEKDQEKNQEKDQEKNQEKDQEKNQEKDQERTTRHSRTREETQEQTSAPASNSPTGAISELTVEDLSSQTSEDILKRWRIEHNLKLQSSYDHKLSPDGRDEITTCHSRTAMTVDYILYTQDSPSPSLSSSSLPRGRGLQLLGRLSLVGRSELEQVNGLPNQNHSSDHLPLLARFRLRR